MNINAIKLVGLFCHQNTKVVFPETGLVLVTGPNGGGKSSLCEAIAVACWGKTLRGSEPWQAGQKSCHAQVIVTEGKQTLEITRIRKGAKTALNWGIQDVAPTTYETTTKAQTALETIIGPWDVWRRCSVFSSHDAAHFTRATDSERKRLLEDVLGLDRFDVALAACRADLKAAERERGEAASSLAVTEARVMAAQQRIADAHGTLAQMTHPNPPAKADGELDAKVVKLTGMANSTRTEIQNARFKLRTADDAGASLRAQAAMLRRTLGAIRADTCPTCTQRIPEMLRADLEYRASAAVNEANASQATAHAEVADVEALVVELEEELAALDGKLREAQHQASEARIHAQRDAQMLRTRTQAAKTLADAQAEQDREALKLQSLGWVVEKTTKRVEILTACEQVLGLKGVRAMVLGKALGGIEAVANSWLERLIGRELKLHLSPCQEKKAGGITEAISLTVEGAGGGNGYAGSSGGERRRIDIAILLALAEVAAGASGMAPGTLWFDEVFDTLDGDGAERAAEVLRELSETRCVVVISHSAEVVRSLNADVHLAIENGTVTQK